MSDREFIQSQQIPPEIDPEDEYALRRVIELARSVYSKQYDLEQRIVELEKIVLK